MVKIQVNQLKKEKKNMASRWNFQYLHAKYWRNNKVKT